MTDRVRERLVEFVDRRMNHEAAQRYTVVVDGQIHNAGEFRDNLVDVIEELSDAINIMGILARRLGTQPDLAEWAHIARALHHMQAACMQLMVNAYDLRVQLPRGFAMDDATKLGAATPQRIVTLDEVGL